MESSTHWGAEFSGVSPVDAEPVQAAAQGAWPELLAALKAAHERQPECGVAYLELASTTHLLHQGDRRGAIVRLHFALGRRAPTDIIDAIVERLAPALLADGDPTWAALAWQLHDAGAEPLRALVSEGHVTEAWLEDDGYDAMEDLVFARADETGDPGWIALSAMIGSRDLHDEVDEETVLAHAEPVTPDNPRAWAIALQVLLGLERDDDAELIEGRALEALGDDPRKLLELLDAADADDALPRVTRAVGTHYPDWLTRRRTPAAIPILEPRPLPFEGLSAESGLAELTKMVLPEPPRRTDDAWLETKRKGDEAMKEWLGMWLGIAVAVAALGWFVLRLL